jgi:hypothetical protein
VENTEALERTLVKELGKLTSRTPDDGFARRRKHADKATERHSEQRSEEGGMTPPDCSNRLPKETEPRQA